MSDVEKEYEKLRDYINGKIREHVTMVDPDGLVPRLLLEVTAERDQLRAKLAKATDPAYLAEKIEQVGMVDKEWQARAEAAEAKLAEYRKLVQAAYNEGFVQGMREQTSSRGGIPWSDSAIRSRMGGEYETREGNFHVTGVKVSPAPASEGGNTLADRARIEAAQGPTTGEVLQSFAKAAPELFGDGPGPSSTAYDQSGYAKEAK